MSQSQSVHVHLHKKTHSQKAQSHVCKSTTCTPVPVSLGEFPGGSCILWGSPADDAVIGEKIAGFDGLFVGVTTLCVCTCCGGWTSDDTLESALNIARS